MEPKVSRIPTLRISSKLKEPFHVKLRSYPTTNRASINADIAYFLGLLLARGEVKRKSLIIRIPCRYKNAVDHKEFLLSYAITRLEKATSEKLKVYGDRWRDYSFEVTIESSFFHALLKALEIAEGKVYRFAGVPYEVFNSEDDVKREFIKGIGDCCGEVDKYIGGKPRVCLRFLNENVGIIEDVVELLVRLSVEIFDVNLSPASSSRPNLATKMGELRSNLIWRYGVSVTGRKEQIGRDNMVRIWANEYYTKIGFYNKLRQDKLITYLEEFSC